jgi:hypothetical protein
MRYLKVFSVLLVLGVFVSSMVQARDYQNLIIPFDKSQFSKILNEKFDSGELSVQDALSQYPTLGESRQDIIDKFWEALSMTRNGILSEKFKGGGVNLDNSINDYEIGFMFDGGSADKIHVKASLPD